jgi:hypothetical protein
MIADGQVPDHDEGIIDALVTAYTHDTSGSDWQLKYIQIVLSDPLYVSYILFRSRGLSALLLETLSFVLTRKNYFLF